MHLTFGTERFSWRWRKLKPGCGWMWERCSRMEPLDLPSGGWCPPPSKYQTWEITLPDIIVWHWFNVSLFEKWIDAWKALNYPCLHWLKMSQQRKWKIIVKDKPWCSCFCSRWLLPPGQLKLLKSLPGCPLCAWNEVWCLSVNNREHIFPFIWVDVQKGFSFDHLLISLPDCHYQGHCVGCEGGSIALTLPQNIVFALCSIALHAYISFTQSKVCI